MDGICTVCQTKNPVKPINDTDASMGEAGRFVMVDHRAFGEWCEGAGTHPQALVPTMDECCPGW